MKQLSFFAAAEVDGALYFSAWTRNGLFRMHPKTGDITYIGRFLEEEREANLHQFAYVYQNAVYFFPSAGTHIAKLQLKDGAMQTIALPNADCCGTLNKFSDLVRHGEDLWLIPESYDALVRFHLPTEQIERYENWPDGFHREKMGASLFCAGACVSGQICMCPHESDWFVTFDLQTKQMRKWEWKYPKMAFCRMAYHNETLWFFPERDYPDIVGYEPQSGAGYRIPMREKGKEGAYALYGNAAVLRERIVLLPYESDHWIVLDTRTHQISAVPLERREGQKEAGAPLFQAVTYFENGFIATSGLHEWEQLVASEQMDAAEIRIVADDAEWMRMWERIVDDGGISYGKSDEKMQLFYETDMSLELYLQIVQDFQPKSPETADGICCGEAIYRATCGRDGA